MKIVRQMSKKANLMKKYMAKAAQDWSQWKDNYTIPKPTVKPKKTKRGKV